MKIVGAVRTLNEDDIIEAVLRHHLVMMDFIIILDDGSNDGTVDIVKKMISEGLPLALIENRCVIANQKNRATFLYEQARDVHGADWIVLFDADEFIDTRPVNMSLRNYLELMPADVDAFHICMVNYLNAATDDGDELIVPKRMVWCDIAPNTVDPKIVLRAKPGIVVHAGNHNADIDGKPIVIFKEKRIILAHYFRRSAWHEIYKCIIGRLKVMASGSLASNTGYHYVRPFEIMTTDPMRLLKSNEYFNKLPDKKIMHKNPLAYMGGELKYTGIVDYKAKCICLVLRYASELATEFGQIMDADPALREKLIGRPMLENH